MSGKRTCAVSFDRTSAKFVGLQENTLSELKTRFSHINIEEELSKMARWLLSPSGSRRQGTLDFINKWLLRIEPPKSVIYAKPSPSSNRFFDEYLSELWKDQQALLDFNTLKR